MDGQEPENTYEYTSNFVGNDKNLNGVFDLEAERHATVEKLAVKMTVLFTLKRLTLICYISSSKQIGALIDLLLIRELVALPSASIFLLGKSLGTE